MMSVVIFYFIRAQAMCSEPQRDARSETILSTSKLYNLGEKFLLSSLPPNINNMCKLLILIFCHGNSKA